MDYNMRMESSLTIYPIKSDKVEKVKSLISELKKHKAESLETLKEAEIYLETIFIQNNCLFVYKITRNLENMKNIQNRSEHKLYEKIRPVLSECLKKGHEIRPDGEFFNLPKF